MPQRAIILDPSAPTGQTVSAPAHVLDRLSGKVVGFIDNTKPNFNVLVDDLAELLVRQYGAAGVVRHRKRMPSDGAAEAVIEDLRDKCDLVITGSGD